LLIRHQLRGGVIGFPHPAKNLPPHGRDHRRMLGKFRQVIEGARIFLKSSIFP
jgi:hypothetical protein